MTQSKRTPCTPSRRYAGVCWVKTARGRKWGFRLDVGKENGRRREVHLHKCETEDEAREERERLRKGEQKPKAQAHTLADLVERYLAHRLTRNTHKATYKQARRILRAWLKLLPPGIAVLEIEQAHIYAFIDSRRSKVSESTIDQNLTYINACLNFARLTYPDLRQYQRPMYARPKYSKDSPRVLVSDQQYRQLVEYLLAPRHSGEHLRTYKSRIRLGRFFRFMMLTGLRTNEAAGVRKDRIEWERRRVGVFAPKTKKTRYIEITPEVEAILIDQLAVARPDSPFVFTKGGEITNRMYKRFRQACRALGLPDDLDLYSARHTFATSLLRANVDIRTVGEALGHTKLETTKIYARAASGGIGSVVSQIEQARLQGEQGEAAA